MLGSLSSVLAATRTDIRCPHIEIACRGVWKLILVLVAHFSDVIIAFDNAMQEDIAF